MIATLLFISLLSQQTNTIPRELPAGPDPTAFLACSFSPDGEQILFSRVDDAANFNPELRTIWIANSDGTNPVKITTGVGSPEWTRDGKSILYLRNLPTGSDACIYDLAAQKERSLGIKLSMRNLDCSPTQDLIAFSAELGNKVIQGFTCDLNGQDVRQVTFGPGKAYTLQWSPDGKSIVFYRELGDGKDQIYTMKADGSAVQHISPKNTHNFFPDFLSNGLISYTQAKSPNDNTVLIADRRGIVKSTFPFKTSRVRWSPDGKKAIFIAGQFPKMALYICKADGSELKRVGEPSRR